MKKGTWIAVCLILFLVACESGVQEKSKLPMSKEQQAEYDRAMNDLVHRGDAEFRLIRIFNEFKSCRDAKRTKFNYKYPMTSQDRVNWTRELHEFEVKRMNEEYAKYDKLCAEEVAIIKNISVDSIPIIDSLGIAQNW